MSRRARWRCSRREREGQTAGRPATPPPDGQEAKPALRRDLSLKDSIFLGVGGILGAGIYAIVGEAAGLSGGYLWLALLIAAVVAQLTALSYAEFVSAYPDAGGGYEYIKQAFGGKLAAVLGFLLLLTGIIAPAAIALAFGDYLGRLVSVPGLTAAIGVVVLMGLVNSVGVAGVSWFNIGATAVTVGGLLLVIGFGLPALNLENLTAAPAQGIWIGASSGAALAFFSYVGFEDLVGSAEETENPEKVVPRALWISNLIVLVIYLLVAVSAVSLLPAKELAGESGPLSAVMDSAAGRWGAVTLTVIALFATSKTIMTNMMGGSRLLMDMGRDIAWLSFFRTVLPKVHTPVFAIALMVVDTIAFALIGSLKLVATISNFAIYGVYLTVNIALITLRRNAKEYRPRFRLPLEIGGWPVLPVLPVLAIGALLYMLCFNVYNLLAGPAGGGGGGG